MKHIALFNGIGGFQIAAEQMGWENIASCEIDEWCNKVTKYHFPKCIQHGDIKTTDFTIYRGKCDILTGGFPCQPFSVAGKRLGGADERYLWEEMLRAARQIQPYWVVAENVPGLLSIENGSAIDNVCTSLEHIGYEKPVIFDFSADTIGLPTMERHIWIITKNSKIDCKSSLQKSNKNPELQRELPRGHQGEYTRWNTSESKLLRMGEGISRRVDRLRIAAIGNAFPPLQALQIFKAIEQYNQTYFK